MNDEQLDALRADLYQMAGEAGDQGKYDFAHGLFVAIYKLDEKRHSLPRMTEGHRDPWTGPWSEQSV